MDTSIFDLTMNDQILRQQNQEVQKQNQKKQHERSVEDTVQLEVVQEEAKTQGKRKKQTTQLTKRRRVAEALNKKQVKTEKSSKNQETSKSKLSKSRLTKLVKPSTTKESTQAEEKLTPAAENMIKQFGVQILGKNLQFDNELEDLEFLEDAEMPSEVEGEETPATETAKTNQTANSKKTTKPKVRKDSKVVQAHLNKLSPKEKQDYLDKLLNGSSTEILDTLLDPKYLVGSTMTPEQLKQVRKEIRQQGQLFRKIASKAMPDAVRAMRDLGYGDELGEVGQGVPDTSSEKKEKSPNDAIFEAMAASLELTGLLQELGIKSNLIETNIESVTASEEVKEANLNAEKNIQQMHATAHRSKCSKIIQFLSYIAAAVLILMGQPEAGILIIVATSGLLALLIKKLASALGMSQFALKVLIMVIALLVTIVTANPAIMGDAAKSILSSVGNMMIISATIGFTTDLIGVIATGSTDSDNYPSWVGWAAMGINLGAMLPELGLSIYRAGARGMAWLAARTEAKITEAVSTAAASATEAGTEVASVTASRTDSTIAQDLEEGQGSAGERGGAGSSNPATDAANEAAVQGGGQGVGVGEEASLSSSVAPESAGLGSNPDSITANGRASPSENGGSNAETSVEDPVAKNNTAEERVEMQDGGNSTEAGPASQSNSSSNSSSEACSKDLDAGDTKTPKDVAKEKLGKIEKVLEKARADLEKLTNLEEAVDVDAGEEASDLASSKLQSAENKVKQLEKEVESLSKQVGEEEKLEELQDKLAKANKRVESLRAKGKGKEPITGKGKISRAKAYLNSKFGEVGKLLLLLDGGGEAYVQVKMAEIDMELGQLLSEIANLTGNYELLNTFFEIIGSIQATTSQRNDQYSKDMHDEIKLVGDIINAERRVSNLLMSA